MKKFSRRNSDAFGAYSYYFIDGLVGIKVLQPDYSKDALKEFSLLEKAAPSGFTPEPYGIEEVLLNEEETTAIFMQHIEGKTLSDHCEDCEYSDYPTCHGHESRIEILRNKLLNLGIDHRDIHCENVIVYKHKLFIIDFSPELINEEVQAKRKKVSKCTLHVK